MAASSLHDHYHQPDLAGRILAALAAAGLDPGAVSGDDLAGVDEFHVRGREATRELAACAELAPGQSVLDVGCGLGGPARFLASAHGCRVTGVDLVPGYCAAAAVLTKLVGLADRVSFQAGDVRRLPFAAGAFDRVWSQHALMNVADKVAVALEFARVLRPDGLLAMYEVCTGDGRPPHLPVPWASAPGHSHLVGPEALQQAFVAAGFRISQWEDDTAAAVAWLDAVAAARRRRGRDARARRPDLGLVMGPDAGLKSRQLGRNLREGRVVVVRAIGRPGAGCEAS